MGHMGKHMRMMGHQNGPMGHHEGCGCPMCSDQEKCKKKIFMAMIVFGAMAIANMFIVGMLHLMLHAKETFQH